MKERYKVGDKVRIKKNLNDSDHGEPYGVVSDMEELRGKIGVVTSINSTFNAIKLDIGLGYSWGPQMIDKVKCSTFMTLGKGVEWADIEIGEVFAADGCLGILEKRSSKTALVLAIDGVQDRGSSNMNHLVGKIFVITQDFYSGSGLKEKDGVTHWFGAPYARRSKTGFYKLDEETQRLWKVE